MTKIKQRKSLSNRWVRLSLTVSLIRLGLMWFWTYSILMADASDYDLLDKIASVLFPETLLFGYGKFGFIVFNLVMAVVLLADTFVVTICICLLANKLVQQSRRKKAQGTSCT